MIRKAFILLFASLFIVACSTSTERIYKPAPTSPAYPINLMWAHQLSDIGPDRFVRLLPDATNNAIIVADTDGMLWSYAPKTGETLWHKQYDTIFSAGPKVYGNIALLGNKDAEVYSIDVTNGALLWSQTVSSEILVPPQLANNMVVVQTNDGKIFGLRADNGKRVWVYDRNVPILSLRGNSTPSIINDDQVVAGFASGKLVSLSLTDGKLLWETTVALPKGRTELERIIDIDGPIVHQEGTIYVAAYRGRIAAIDANSGAIIWTREMSSHLGLVIDKNLLFLTDSDGRVWALNRDNGATLWMQDKLEERATTRPAIQGNKLVLGDVTGEVYWLAKSDGRLLGHLDHDQVSKASGATFVGDELAGEEPDNTPTAVVFQPKVIGQTVLVTYQNGIIASIATTN